MFPLITIPLVVAVMWRGGPISWCIGAFPLLFAVLLIFSYEVDKNGSNLKIRRFGSWQAIHKEDVQRVRGPLAGFVLIEVISKPIPYFGVTEMDSQSFRKTNEASVVFRNRWLIAGWAAIIGLIAGALLPLPLKPTNIQSFVGFSSLIIWWMNRPLVLLFIAIALGRAAVRNREHTADLFLLTLGATGTLTSAFKQIAINIL